MIRAKTEELKHVPWFAKAGAACSIIPISRFVGPSIFALKGGGYGCLFSLSGLDEEGLTDPELESRVRSIEGSLRGLPEGSCLYQYTRVMSGFDLPRQRHYANEVTEAFANDRITFLKAKAGFRRIDLHWCLTIEPSQVRALGRNPMENTIETSRLLFFLQKTAALLEGHLGSSIGLKQLSKEDAFQFFSYLFNLEEWAAQDQLRSDTGVDRQIVKNPIAWHSDHLQIGKRHVQMFSLKTTPEASRPCLFSNLLTLDCDSVLCTTWRVKSTSAARSEIDSQEKFISFFKVGVMQRVMSGRDTVSLDTGAGAKAANRNVDDLSEVIHALDKKGHGEFSLRLLLGARSPEQLREVTPVVHRVFVDARAQVVEETLGNLSAFYAMFPGNQKFNVFPMWLSEDHHARLSSVFAPHIGHPHSEDLDSEYLNIFETRTRTPFFQDVYVDGVRVMLIIGPTGTGKTYSYIKSIFELNRRYGWSKFIIVVPSIAIREGVFQSLTDTSEHFLEQYGKRVRFFIYNSKELHELESFSADAGINVMVINAQAFNARGKDARRIYEELDDFQTRRPIDVIARNRPILILDEPQKMEGAKTVESLKEFKPLFILRYSATHKQEHNKIYRLDALDAYNRKLVKKIAVRGITVKGQAGTSAYLYLQGIDVFRDKAPAARVEMEILRAGGIKPEPRILGKADNLHDKSGELDQYKGFVVSDINALDNTLSFTNGVVLTAGDAVGDVNEIVLRRLQIREAVAAHFEKEQQLFAKGIKVLSLFFIDEVAKYRVYQGDEAKQGEYAQLFEEEYNARLNEILTLGDNEYNQYLRGIATDRTHEGYFSIDRKTKRQINPETGAKSDESDDVDAYDRILKRKSELLSFKEPIRFIFSHSALREGWDNPNVFVIGMLKKADPEKVTTRRQEVGRGLRLSVNQNGDRMDDPATVHELNVLTVVASEGYKEFVAGLQKDIAAVLSARPQKADEAFFTGKVLKTATGDVPVTPQMATMVTAYLLGNDYVDDAYRITSAYHDAKQAGTVAPLPTKLAAHAPEIFQLIDSVYSKEQLPEIEDGRKGQPNPLNANFHKKAFRELWSRIHRKAIYSVQFETTELITKCVQTLDAELKVAPLQYVVQRGEQAAETTYEALKAGQTFELEQTQTAQLKSSVHSEVKYDLIGKLAEETKLTRATIGAILRGIASKVFALYRVNPEDFLRVACRLINEQKATVIVEHLTYDAIEEEYGLDIFTQEKDRRDLHKAVKTNLHIYDYVFTDSQSERNFVKELDTGTDIEVYSKLPKSFSIPTPVGSYNPDWAIAFKQGTVKHIYFIAETKGSLSSMELREIEKSKIECARKFFAKLTSDQVRYDVVTSYSKLMELVH